MTLPEQPAAELLPSSPSGIEPLYGRIHAILMAARTNVVRTVNTEMVKQGLMAPARQGQEVQTPEDAIKDPVVLEFLGLPKSSRLVESDLEEALLTTLQAFLLEMGKGFAFVARQQRLTLDGDHFYVDLVFYHAVLKCYVLVDLKTGKLTHGDMGQMQFYVNYCNAERRTEADNATIGLILCADKNDAVVRYTLDKANAQVFASRYQLHLPSEQELAEELRRELRQARPLEEKKRAT